MLTSMASRIVEESGAAAYVNLGIIGIYGTCGRRKQLKNSWERWLKSHHTYRLLGLSIAPPPPNGAGGHNETRVWEGVKYKKKEDDRTLGRRYSQGVP